MRLLNTDDIVYFVISFPVNRFNNGRVNDLNIVFTNDTCFFLFAIFFLVGEEK